MIFTTSLQLRYGTQTKPQEIMEKGEVSGRSHTHTHTFIRNESDTHKQPCVCSPSLDLLCIHQFVQILYLYRFLQQRGWRNDEINARIECIKASSTGEEVEEDEGLYATYAMLHIDRNE